MLIKPDVKRIARIKLVGIGGAGCNAITTMLGGERIEGVEFIAVNTDAQALLSNKAETKLQIGDKVTRGLGAGGNPDVGKNAAEESREKIKEYLEGADLVFITTGMGGGTGTGASPIIAEVAKETGALTIAVATKPFLFEGSRRMFVANDGIEKLKEKVDALITIPNQKILEFGDKQITLVNAFKEIDSVLRQGVKGLAEIITLSGLI
ncbi:MAG: cell division protein FtsZ, partial [Patescibacteria group bacterium]